MGFDTILLCWTGQFYGIREHFWGLRGNAPRSLYKGMDICRVWMDAECSSIIPKEKECNGMTLLRKVAIRLATLHISLNSHLTELTSHLTE